MIGGIDEIHADFDGTEHHGDGLFFTGIAQLALKRRTAVADRRNFQAILAEKAILHGVSPPAGLDHDHIMLAMQVASRAIFAKNRANG
jgi:hypothetical protein